jgi:membrane dipeptidase
MSKTLRYFTCLALILLYISCSRDDANQDLTQRASEIHQKVLTIDSHTDTPLQLVRSEFDLSKRHDPYQRGGGKLDFPRMKEGGLDAVFFAVFVAQGPRTEEGNLMAKEKALNIFDRVHKAIQQNSKLAQLAYNPDDAYRFEREGKFAVFLGMENGYPLGTDLSLLEKYYNLGARYITLCHTKNNDICDSSTDPNGPEHQGLSALGEKVVFEMNKLGIMIDVSHISDEAFYDVLDISKAPVIASHSCARALCDHPRNLDDQMLKTLAAKGGVIQMCILSMYVKAPPPNPQREEEYSALIKEGAKSDQMSEKEREELSKKWYTLRKKYAHEMATVSDVVDHIDHIVKLIGIDHVGIGTDFDGGGGVQGCYDVSEIGNITLELVKRGYNEQQISKIWGANIIRVFREVQQVASELQKEVS